MKKKDAVKEQLLSKIRSKNTGFLQSLALIGQLGLVMISSIVIWFFLARYLIVILNISQVWLIAGIILGISTGMMGSYKLLKKIMKTSD